MQPAFVAAAVAVFILNCSRGVLDCTSLNHFSFFVLIISVIEVYFDSTKLKCFPSFVYCGHINLMFLTILPFILNR